MLGIQKNIRLITQSLLSVIYDADNGRAADYAGRRVAAPPIRTAIISHTSTIYHVGRLTTKLTAAYRYVYYLYNLYYLCKSHGDALIITNFAYHFAPLQPPAAGTLLQDFALLLGIVAALQRCLLGVRVDDGGCGDRRVRPTATGRHGSPSSIRRGSSPLRTTTAAVATALQRLHPDCCYCCFCYRYCGSSTALGTV